VGKQKPLTKGKAAFLVAVSTLGAILSVLELHGWHAYAGLGAVGVLVVAGFLLWNRENPTDESPQ